MSFAPARLSALLADLPRPTSYWVAYSGGLDSTVLLHALARQRHALAAPLHAVHVNHGLHADADAWEAHCRTTCDRLAVPCASHRARVSAPPGASPEAQARAARYAAFDAVLPAGALLLTAHHRDDQAETLLLQLLRGAGPAGLAAAAPVARRGAGWLARPLLGWDRAALRRYADACGLQWLEDPSNAEVAFDRNFLRHRVVPVLAARWPGHAATLARSAALCAEAQQVLDEVAGELFAADPLNRPWQLSIAQLLGLPAHRQHLLLRHWLRRSGLPLPDANRLRRLVDEVAAARADAAPRVAWPGGEVRRYRGCLHALPGLPAAPGALQLPWLPGVAGLELPPGLGVLRLGSAGVALPAAAWQGARVSVRFGAAEPAAPAGRQGRRRFKRLCQDLGVPPWLRRRVPLLYLDDRVAALGDYGTCEPYAAAPGEPVVRLAWERAPWLH